MIPVRPSAAPINRACLAACAHGAAAWLLWPSPGSFWGFDLLALVNGVAGVSFAIRSLRLLIADRRLRKHIKVSQRKTNDHGSARQATWEEIVAAGMDKPSSGKLLGIHKNGRTVWAPRGPFSLYVGPPGTYKTIAGVVPSLLHIPHLGYSVFAPDPKNELAVMLAASLRAQGFEVNCINPGKAFMAICGDMPINPYQALLNAVYASGEDRKNSAKIVMSYALIHVPEKPDEKNHYFTHGARRVLVVAILYIAITNPANCTPTEAYRLIVDPTKFLNALRFIAEHLQTAIENDQLLDFLKGEAANLLHRSKENEENFASFCEQATQRLLPFGPSGKLANYGASAIHEIADIRKRQQIWFVMTHVSDLQEFAPFVSLLNENVLAGAKANPTGHKVRIVAEEALNYQFTNLVSDMEMVRGLGISIDFYVQSYAGLEKKYGKEAARAITSYADYMVVGGINSLDWAQHVSNMLSDHTVRKQDYSYGAIVESVGVSSREVARRQMTVSELMAMPRDKVWVFPRGQNPSELTVAHYGYGLPWQNLVADNPIEGRALRADPLFHIAYPARGGRA